MNLFLATLITISSCHAVYSPSTRETTSSRSPPSTDSFITTLSKIHHAFSTLQGDTTPSHHLADHLPSMHGDASHTSTSASSHPKSVLSSHPIDAIYDMKSQSHDLPEMFHDTHRYMATMMKVMAFPTLFSDLDAEAMANRLAFFTTSSPTPTAIPTATPSTSHIMSTLQASTPAPEYRDGTIAFASSTTFFISNPDTPTLSIPIICYNCSNYNLSYTIRIQNITAIPGIDYVDIGVVTQSAAGNVTYVNVTQGSYTYTETITTSNFSLPLIFNPYYRISYLTARSLTLTLFNITNMDTGVSNLPWGANNGTYSNEIVQTINIMPAYPRVGFSVPLQNLTDVSTYATVQVDCQYCQGLDVAVRLRTESIDSQAGIDFDDTTATLIWLSRNGTNTTNGGSMNGGGGNIIVPTNSSVPYSPQIMIIDMNDMRTIFSQNITIPMHPRRSLRYQRHFHVLLRGGNATLAGTNMASHNTTWNWNGMIMPANFTIPLKVDPDQIEMIIQTTPYCNTGDLHYANRTVYLCNDTNTRLLPSQYQALLILNLNGTRLNSTNGTCANVTSYFGLTDNNATYITAIYDLCAPYLNTTLNTTNITGNSNSTYNTLPSPSDPDLPVMCHAFQTCQYSNSCVPIIDKTPVCYCPYNHYGPTCQYNKKITCKLGALRPVMNQTTCDATNKALGKVYDIELDGAPPCYIMSPDRTTLSYYLDCHFDDTPNHIREGPDDIEIIRLQNGEYVWNMNYTLQNYTLKRYDPETKELILAFREVVQPGIRAYIVNFYRLSDTTQTGTARVSMQSLYDPYNLNNSIDFWFNVTDLKREYVKMGRIYIEAQLMQSAQFPGPTSYPLHTMHLEVPNYHAPPYVSPSTLSDGAIAAIVIVVVLFALGAALAYYRYRMIQKKQEAAQAARDASLRVPLLSTEQPISIEPHIDARSPAPTSPESNTAYQAVSPREL